jgi:hypothetical protein
MRVRIYEQGKFGLWIGDEASWREITDPEKFAVVLAAKDPWHRSALRYTGRSAPKEHPEYLLAYRPIHSREPNRIILNLVDVENPAYVAPEIIAAALAFIDQNIEKKDVLCCCNKGMSRSATIGLLYLRKRGLLPAKFEDAEDAFRKLYAPYNPGNGMREFARAQWTPN